MHMSVSRRSTVRNQYTRPLILLGSHKKCVRHSGSGSIWFILILRDNKSAGQRYSPPGRGQRVINLRSRCTSDPFLVRSLSPATVRIRGNGLCLRYSGISFPPLRASLRRIRGTAFPSTVRFQLQVQRQAPGCIPRNHPQRPWFSNCIHSPCLVSP